MSVHQKLGIILENKVVQKLKLGNNVCTKKWSSQLVFLNEKKIRPFLTSKIYFENTILALFDKPTFTDGIVFNFFL